METDISHLGQECAIPIYSTMLPLAPEWLLPNSIGGDVIARVTRWIGYYGVSSDLKRDNIVQITPNGLVLAQRTLGHPAMADFIERYVPPDGETHPEVISIGQDEGSEMSVIPQRETIDGKRYIFVSGEPLPFLRQGLITTLERTRGLYNAQEVEVMAQFQLALMLEHEEQHRKCRVIAIGYSPQFYDTAKLAIGTQIHRFGSKLANFTYPLQAQLTHFLLSEVAGRGLFIFEGGKVSILLDNYLVGEFGYGLNEGIMDYISTARGDQFAEDHAKAYRKAHVDWPRLRQRLHVIAAPGMGTPEYKGEEVGAKKAAIFLGNIGITSADEAFRQLLIMPPLLRHLALGGTAGEIPTAYPQSVLRRIVEY
jgi:hypothetical protein